MEIKLTVFHGGLSHTQKRFKT